MSYASVHNSCIGTPFREVVSGSIAVLALTVIALSIIGLAASPSGPFNVIVQLGKAVNGTLLGTSIFVFILDIVWLGTLCKKQRHSLTNENSSQSPSILSPGILVGSELFNTQDLFYQNGMGDELFAMIFSELSTSQRVACSRVSKKFCRLALSETLWMYNPRNVSPLIKIFDAADWNRYVDMSAYGLTTEDKPNCNARETTAYLEDILSSPLMNEIEANEGITLLTIPKHLTLRKLVKLAKSPKQGETLPNFRSTLPYVLSEIGDIEVDNTYRIVITNNVLKKSRDLPFLDQKVQLNQLGCKIPRVVEAVALLVVTFIASKKRLYNDFPLIFTRCQEEIGGFPYVVGDFSSQDGIDIDYHRGRHGYGVGGVLRKF